MDGWVKQLTDYGAFVDLGGIEGLLHISEMSWAEPRSPGQLFKPGDAVKVKVLTVDRVRGRVSLSCKQLYPDPWQALSERLGVASRVSGRVSDLTNRGAHVEIEEGLVGFIPLSEITSARHLNHPAEVLTRGQEVEAVVTALEPKNRRLLLSIKGIEPFPTQSPSDVGRKPKAKSERAGSTPSDGASQPQKARPFSVIKIPIFVTEEHEHKHGSAGLNSSVSDGTGKSLPHKSAASSSDVKVMLNPHDSDLGSRVESGMTEGLISASIELSENESAAKNNGQNGGGNMLHNDEETDRGFTGEVDGSRGSEKGRHGEGVLRGTVLRMTGEGVIVDFGVAERLVGWNKFVSENNKMTVAPSPGQTVEAIVTGSDNATGFISVSQAWVLPVTKEPPKVIQKKPQSGKRQQRNPPAGKTKSEKTVSDYEVVAKAALVSIVIAALFAFLFLVWFLLFSQPTEPPQPPPEQRAPSAEAAPTSNPLCRAGSECIVVTRSHLRPTAGKFNDEGVEKDSLGIATEKSRVLVLEEHPDRKNWRRVKVLKHVGYKKQEWKDEGWMDADNLQPPTKP